MLRQTADFPMDKNGPVGNLKKAELSSLSDYVYPVLMDIDPEQGVEDEYKNKHNQLFCWRMLKLIAQVDLTTFKANKPLTTEESKD